VCRQLRQVLAELNAGHAGRNGLELAANAVGRGRLHVPHVEVAGTAIQEDQHARVGPRCWAGFFGGQELGQRQAHQPQPADLQQVAAGDHALTAGLHGACGSRRRMHCHLLIAQVSLPVGFGLP